MAVGGVSNLFQVSLYIDLKSIESPEDFGPLSEFVLLVVHGESRRTMARKTEQRVRIRRSPSDR